MRTHGKEKHGGKGQGEYLTLTVGRVPHSWRRGYVSVTVSIEKITTL
jgi:hypothetical protein